MFSVLSELSDSGFSSSLEDASSSMVSSLTGVTKLSESQDGSSLSIGTVTVSNLTYKISYNTNKKYTQKNVLSITHIYKIIKE